ncbi:MAG: DUF4394 domain-containing protein [Xanthobacteraceae bacterium]
MSKYRNHFLGSLALIGALGAAEAASAQALVALVGDNTIAMIDPASRKVTASWPVKGANKLVGIDVRPADGMLYGITDNGWIVTIDTKTGAATQKAELSTKLPAGVTATIDFNPAADRLRLMGSDGTSHRANVDDGKVIVDGNHKYADADANKGKTPKVVAGAYSNSVKGTKETALYNIDASNWNLVRQAPPNDGVLNTIGNLGVKAAEPIAFNIVATGEGQNAAWLVSGGTLYSVDIGSGKATAAGAIMNLKGTIRDIAWWPADAMKPK